MRKLSVFNIQNAACTRDGVDLEKDIFQVFGLEFFFFSIEQEYEPRFMLKVTEHGDLLFEVTAVSVEIIALEDKIYMDWKENVSGSRYGECALVPGIASWKLSKIARHISYATAAESVPPIL